MVQASAKKLEHTGPAEKVRVASVPPRKQLAKRRSRSCQKEKEQCRLPRVRDHEGGESQGGREPHLGERGGKGGLHREGKFQGGKEGQAT